MSMVSRDELKKRGLRRFANSFSYAFDGLKYAFKYEQNLVVHIIATILVVIMGTIFHISAFEWALCILAIGLVIATELINTSIEAIVDLVSPEYSNLAKIAKDTAAAAVLVFAVAAIILALIIFSPKIILFIQTL